VGTEKGLKGVEDGLTEYRNSPGGNNGKRGDALRLRAKQNFITGLYRPPYGLVSNAVVY
jgi:hypothetical protein